MTIRTSKTIVTFRRPFLLGGFEETLPAGSYSVETDEERLEGISFPAYRRIATLIHLPATPAHPGRTQTLSIDPKDLEAALKRDGAPEDTPPADEGTAPTMLEGTPSPHDKADRRALERAEDEGMIAHPG